MGFLWSTNGQNNKQWERYSIYIQPHCYLDKCSFTSCTLNKSFADIIRVLGVILVWITLKLSLKCIWFVCVDKCKLKFSLTLSGEITEIQAKLDFEIRVRIGFKIQKQVDVSKQTFQSAFLKRRWKIKYIWKPYIFLFLPHNNTTLHFWNISAMYWVSLDKNISCSGLLDQK